ncbi:hypothetical protein CYMTET_10685 [Cymbomonas tetramitiformis]|uniref:Uncharacterized protein n=1 Tax=Cymbomonas tetramitiformis TaxID=36881 RepID=A0AAE0GNT3_9CHLO|nr:hypothetical protein CYMTET_10685 [Cymbomonas tetramitiformis]
MRRHAAQTKTIPFDEADDAMEIAWEEMDWEAIFSQAVDSIHVVRQAASEAQAAPEAPRAPTATSVQPAPPQQAQAPPEAPQAPAAPSMPQAPPEQFRRITAEQIEKRLLTLDDDTLLALKMNPSIDTSETGPLFIGKSASLELMDAVYNRQLRLRGKHLYSVGAIKLRGSQEVGATENVEDLLSALISAEKDLFEKLCETRVTSGKFVDKKTDEFDQCAFYTAHATDFPIHVAVFRADAGSKRSASANIEFVFSGAGASLADFHSRNLSANMLEMYMFIRTNWQYEFLRPTVDQIGAAYLKKYGREIPEPEYEEDEVSDCEAECDLE